MGEMTPTAEETTPTDVGRASTEEAAIGTDGREPAPVRPMPASVHSASEATARSAKTARKDARPNRYVDTPQGMAPARSVNVDNHGEAASARAGINVDTTPDSRSSNVDKIGIGIRPWRQAKGTPTYHPPQPVRAMSPEADAEPVGTIGDTVERRKMGIEAQSFWNRQPDKAALQTLMGARVYLDAFPQRAYAPRTLKEYDRALKRMGDRLPADMAAETSKKVAYVYRAALLHDLLSRRLPTAVNSGWAAIAAMDIDGVADAAAEVEAVMDLLDTYPPDRKHEAVRQGIRSSFYDLAREGMPKEELAASRPRASRRRKLSRLPTDWRARMWKTAVTHSKIPHRHLAAIAILGIVGIRPQELEDGVEIDATSGTGIAITVTTPAKSCGGIFGLGPRTHSRSISGTGIGAEEARWLHKYGRRQGGAVIVKIRHKHLTRLLAALSRRAMPDVEPVWPYDYRHQYSADAKKLAKEAHPHDGEDRRIFVAERLGHSSPKSQQVYGVARQSRGGRKLAADSVTLLDSAKASRLRKPSPSVGASPNAATVANEDNVPEA